MQDLLDNNSDIPFQDSSLGSFEGEPGMSSESLSDIPGGEQRVSRRLRQRPLTALDSSLYAQVEHKKKRRPPPAHLSRHLGKTKSVDPVTMTTSLSGLEVSLFKPREGELFLLTSFTSGSDETEDYKQTERLKVTTQESLTD